MEGRGEGHTWLVIETSHATTQSLKVLLEKTAHLNDTVSHTLDFLQPLLLDVGIVQRSGGCDTGAGRRSLR